MSVAVLIPWAGQCAHRIAALSYVRTWYARNFPDWQVCIGESSSGAQWCKAGAVREALRQTAADTLVIADADCIAPKVGEAVEAVRSGSGWAMPHFTVHRLSEEGSRSVMHDEADPAHFPRTPRFYAQMPYGGYPGGGIVVVPRNTYASTPLDPRFIGWGQEDESWAMALKCLHGAPWRPRNAPLWHLWHPPQNRMSRSVGSPASQELRATYRRIADPRSMERNLATARNYIEQALMEGAQSCIPA